MNRRLLDQHGDWRLLERLSVLFPLSLSSHEPSSSTAHPIGKKQSAPFFLQLDQQDVHSPSPLPVATTSAAPVWQNLKYRKKHTSPFPDDNMIVN